MHPPSSWRRLAQLPHERRLTSVESKLTAGPLGLHRFDVLGHRPRTVPGPKGSFRFNRLPEAKRDYLLSCLADTNDLRVAFQICGRVGAVLAVLVCHPTSRGEALLLGATHWNRSNTDGNTFLSYSLRRAGYEVLIERINLYGNVTMYPFHIRLLSALVVRDFIVQDTESGYLSLGPCLQNFAANYEQPFAASDIVAFLLDCEVLAAQSWGGINRAQCWEGIDHAKALMRLPLDERLCAKYGLATPERILSAGRFPPVYGVDMHIQDKNLGYVYKKEETMLRVVKGELPGVRVVCVDPSLGVPSPKSFVFPSALVRRIRSAGLRELEELSRQEPCRSLFEDAGYLSARLPVRSGLRSGASHPQYVPSISALPDIFKGEFWSNGSYCSTLLMAIGLEYQTVDGEPLCSKGETPPLQLVGAARAKRDSMVRAAGGGTEHVEHLRAADAYRDVLFKQVVPMLGAPLRDIRSVICDCVVAAAVAKDAKAALKELYFVERTAAAAVAADAKHALKEAAKAARKRQRADCVVAAAVAKDAKAALKQLYFVERTVAAAVAKDAKHALEEAAKAARKRQRSADAAERKRQRAERKRQRYAADAAERKRQREEEEDAALFRRVQPLAARIAADIPSAPAARDPSFYTTSSDAEFFGSMVCSAADQNAYLESLQKKRRR